MKQHIKTHRLDPVEMKAAVSIIPDSDLKVENPIMAQLNLPLPNFPDNGLNRTQ